MGKNTSISLGDHFERFLDKEVKSGRYGSVSEVIRAALRILENEEKKVKILQNALIVGEKSELKRDFDPKAHLKSLRKNKQ